MLFFLVVLLLLRVHARVVGVGRGRGKEGGRAVIKPNATNITNAHSTPKSTNATNAAKSTNATNAAKSTNATNATNAGAKPRFFRYQNPFFWGLRPQKCRQGYPVWTAVH